MAFTSAETPDRFATSPAGSRLRGIAAQSPNAPSTVGGGTPARYEREMSDAATLTSPPAERSSRARPNVSFTGSAAMSAATNKVVLRSIDSETGNVAVLGQAIIHSVA